MNPSTHGQESPPTLRDLLEMSTQTHNYPNAAGTELDASEGTGERAPRRARGRRFDIAIVLLIACGVSLATYAISSGLSATFRSSTQLRVQVDEASGLGSDSLLASNELTAQLVQLVPTQAVLAKPAAQLGVSVATLRSSISAGSVAQQNLLQITAEAPSAAQAQLRASTVTKDFAAYLTKDTKHQIAAYTNSLTAQIQAVNHSYARLAKQLQTATGSQANVIQGELGSLAGQQQSLRNQVTNRTAAGVPSIQLVQDAGAGSQVAPRPTLYAIVAFVVAAFVAAQLLALSERRRRAAAHG
jgi:capsular polysaccharide biosynthesis protein